MQTQRSLSSTRAAHTKTCACLHPLASRRQRFALAYFARDRRHPCRHSTACHGSAPCTGIRVRPAGSPTQSCWPTPAVSNAGNAVGPSALAHAVSPRLHCVKGITTALRYSLERVNPHPSNPSMSATPSGVVAGCDGLPRAARPHRQARLGPRQRQQPRGPRTRRCSAIATKCIASTHTTPA